MKEFLFKPRFTRWELVFVIFVPVVLGTAHGFWAWLGAFAFGAMVEMIWGERDV